MSGRRYGASEGVDVEHDGLRAVPFLVCESRDVHVLKSSRNSCDMRAYSSLVSRSTLLLVTVGSVHCLGRLSEPTCIAAMPLAETWS